MLKGPSFEPWYLSPDFECAILAALWSKFNIDIYQAHWKKHLSPEPLSPPDHIIMDILHLKHVYVSLMTKVSVVSQIVSQFIYVRIFPIYHRLSWFLKKARIVINQIEDTLLDMKIWYGLLTSFFCVWLNGGYKSRIGKSSAGSVIRLWGWILNYYLSQCIKHLHQWAFYVGYSIT